MLYNGYVFGGHSCPLCMLAQDKIDFEGYDFVDIEYVFEYSNKNETPSIGIPFYAFYKNIGTSENGNTIYAKTYVPYTLIRELGLRSNVFFSDEPEEIATLKEMGAEGLLTNKAHLMCEARSRTEK